MIDKEILKAIITSNDLTMRLVRFLTALFSIPKYFSPLDLNDNQEEAEEDAF